MRHLVTVILVMAMLGAVVSGCDGARHYDSRLTAVDSLMRSAPDSALALVEAIDRDSLHDEADRAYRDLLITQARYKAYVTATSDSDINRALAWYRAHSAEREKLTRAYIYKGAVMQELNHPDSAMLYYKHAEVTAAPDDYFNLGFAKIRIAELYQGSLTHDDDNAAITRLHDAIHYFKALKDTNYLIISLGMLGAIQSEHSFDSAKAYMNQAITLTQQFNPSLQYTYKSKLSGICIEEQDFKRANELAMDVLRNGQQDCYENQYYYYAVISYLRLGLIDSAKYVAGLFPKPYDAVDSINYYNILAEIAKADNNSGKYGEYIARSKELTSRYLFSQSQKGNAISPTELKFDNLRLEVKHKRLYKNYVTLFILITLLVIPLIWIIVKSKKNAKRFEREKILIKQEFEDALTALRLESEKKNSEQISQVISNRLSAMEELYHDLRFIIRDKQRTKKIVPFSSLLSMMNEKNELMELQPSESFWKKLRLSVDGQYKQMITHVEKTYPNLTEQDIKMLCLLCANVTPQIIKLCMNFTNVRSVSNYRNKLTKQKMGLDMDLDEFIEAYMNGNIS